MSISLNNHETRITALENRDVRWDNFISNSVNISSQNPVKICSYDKDLYDIGFVIWTHDSGSSSDHEQITMLPIGRHEYDATIMRVDQSGQNEEIHIVVKEDTVYGYSSGSNTYDNYVLGFWGLKIYYIFRYNICEILKLISPILKF